MNLNVFSFEVGDYVFYENPFSFNEYILCKIDEIDEEGNIWGFWTSRAKPLKKLPKTIREFEAIEKNRCRQFMPKACLSKLNFVKHSQDRIDIMVDIETLGKEADSAIIQIAACVFNINTGEIVDVFNSIIDITTIKEFNVDGETLKWWLQTDSDLLSKIINNKDGLPYRQVLRKFRKWILSLGTNKDNKNIYLWSNGVLFDNRLLKAHMENANITYPIYYRNDRDMRTIVDLACSKLKITPEELKDRFKDEKLTKHDALDDVKQQIKITSYCWSILIEDRLDNELDAGGLKN